MEVVRLPIGELAANCYLAVNGESALVIDPGGEPASVIGRLREKGVRPIAIVLTHGHYDHILGVTGVRDEFGIPVWAHADEEPWPSVRIDRRLIEGDTIAIADLSLRVVFTPGHTRGGICLLGPALAFTGDTLFANDCGRTDLPGGSEPALRESLLRLAGLLGAGDQIYPGHGQPFAYEAGMIEKITAHALK